MGPTHTSLSWTAPTGGAPSFRYWIYQPVAKAILAAAGAVPARRVGRDLLDLCGSSDVAADPSGGNIARPRRRSTFATGCYRDGVEIITWYQTNSITFYDGDPGMTHTSTVRVRIGTGLFSEHSNAVTATTPQVDPNDDTPPSTPTSLGEMHSGDAEFWPSWTESTDNVTPQDFIRYDVYVNGELSDVQCGTEASSINYGTFGAFNTVEVIAGDEAVNESEPAKLIFFL